MHAPVRPAALFCLVLLLLLPRSACAQDDPMQGLYQSAHRARAISMAIVLYSYKNGGQLPPDLAATLEHLPAEAVPKDASPAALIREFYTDPVTGPKVPDDADADWVNEHSSYIYLGRPGITTEDLPDWGNIVIAHLRLDSGHRVPPTEHAPDGELFTAAFIDGHAETMTRQRLEAMIAHTNQVFDALTTGAAFPEPTQTEWNLQAIARALIAYGKAHDDHLPPDLGALLPHIPADGKRLATPKARAAVFLSAHSAANTFIPDEPTPEWVNRNTSYSYLGNDALVRSRIDDSSRLILIHGRAEDAANVSFRSAGEPTIPALAARGTLERFPRPYLEAIASESRTVFSAMRDNKPLPDYHHALRDLRLLKAAADTFARDHEGLLPPDLAATLEYLPRDECPTEQDRASVYLSPRAERSRGGVPPAPTVQWINDNASYAFPAAGRPARWAAESSDRIVLHAPLNEPHEVLYPWGVEQRIPFVPGLGPIWSDSREELERKLAEQQNPP